MSKSIKWLLAILSGLMIMGCGSAHQEVEDDQPRKIEVLFLGHDSEHHNSEAYASILASALADDGINFTYTENPEALNEENLAHYDALMLYANHETITPAQESALLNFVDQGNGFLPIHSASFCFRNSEEYIDLVGAQFNSHDTATFTADIVKADHPITQTLDPFQTWDETYVHTKHNGNNRTILMEREDANHTEPWTWVRTHGDGRVFYTAYGHDERTWNKKGFQELLKNAIVWSVNDPVKKLWEEYVHTIPELQYEDRANIPNYEDRDPAPKYQLPLGPEASQKHIQVPKGFELTLFASEPDIVNPIDMTWDAKGRLWVIETVDYPNTVREEDGTGDDKIKILEDTNDDGKADKVTVFEDSLNIPTSLAFVNGGVVVSQAPHILFLKDNDGDDKADVRKKIISGWGTFDTHAGPSHLQYGFDNKIWGSVGYSGFEGKINGDSLKFSQGFFRFNTDFENINLEYLAKTSNNTWGLGFNESFEVFGSTANNTHSVFMGIPNPYYEGYDGPESAGNHGWGPGIKKIDGHYAMHPITRNYRQVDVFNGFTAASGFKFYTARQFPEKYWNKVAFVSEPTGGLIHRAKIEERGAGYIEKDGWNIFAGHDEWVSPVQAKVGPDGSLWIADWYNFIVQHNPTPTVERGGYEAEEGEGNAHVNPLRDRRHGRIYRLTYKGAEKPKPMGLSKDDPNGLIEGLTHSNMFWRLTAQRLLVERGNADVLPDLYKLVKNIKVDELGLNTPAIHALWTIHGLGALAGNNINEKATEIVIDALEHPSPAVRKTAIMVLPRGPVYNKILVASGVLQDPDPKTQLAALLATVEMEPSGLIGKVLHKLSDDEELMEDEWLTEAFKLAANQHEVAYKNAANASPSVSENESAQNQELDASAKIIRIKSVINEIQYDVTEFSVKPGEQVKIIFENPDFMQHNLLICEPGSLEKVGKAADKLAMDPDASEQNYVPDMEEVLFATALVNPNETVTISFTAPEAPGDYPYVCTFPGHWRTMQGTMTVTGSIQNTNL